MVTLGMFSNISCKMSRCWNNYWLKQKWSTKKNGVWKQVFKAENPAVQWMEPTQEVTRHSMRLRFAVDTPFWDYLHCIKKYFSFRLLSDLRLYTSKPLEKDTFLTDKTWLGSDSEEEWTKEQKSEWLSLGSLHSKHSNWGSRAETLKSRI